MFRKDIKKRMRCEVGAASGTGAAAFGPGNETLNFQNFGGILVSNDITYNSDRQHTFAEGKEDVNVTGQFMKQTLSGTATKNHI